MRRSVDHQARRGMTLIEVIVVVVILLVVLSLLMPAVSRSRFAARRTQCRNNLKQIGMALHNYHDTHGTFPPGYTIDANGRYLGWSWSTYILPHCDQKSLYEQLDLSAGVAQITKARDHNFSNAVFLCPDERDWANIEHVLLNSSEVKEGVVPPGDYDVANVFPKSTYFGNAGYLQASVGGIDAKFYENVQSRSRIMNSASLGNTGTPTSQAHRYCDQKNFQGVFGQNSRISFRELSDGASNVILVGERYVPRNKSIDAVGSGSWYGVADCTTASGLAMALADTSVPLNAGKSTLAETTGFGSAHAGGAQILLADGSVRFISNSIEIGLYRNLSTIADGMSVPDF